MITDPRDLTPVIGEGRVLFKRDDLFQPFGYRKVNGGKLRQAYLLVEKVLAQGGCKGLISACSVHSPQGPIVAAVARHFGISATILYGGTTKDSIRKMPMPNLVAWYGGRIDIIAKTGRHNVLYSHARKIATEQDLFVVEYGINLDQHRDVLMDSVSQQVANIPDCDDLVITCGSGITSAGILVGLQRYNPQIANIHLVGVGPNRQAVIAQRIGEDLPGNLHYHDLFNRKGFHYEAPCRAQWGSIIFHPNYEAKAFSWLYHQSGIDLKDRDRKTLFWIVGAEPVAGIETHRGVKH